MTEAPPAADSLPDYLVATVPGFAGSPELAGVAARQDRLAAISGALGLYLLRLQRLVIRREADPAEEATIARAYTLLEELAASDDPTVRDALVRGILEPLHSDDVVVAVLETNLGPQTVALYRRWAV